jgi:uncharacterized protein YciI
MPAFAYRILPPRPDFVATITAVEGAVMGEHFAYLQELEAAGRVIFVGRCENGDYGFGVFEFANEAEARSVMARDPAVASGLMHMELHPFRVVMERRRPEAVGSPIGAG